MKLKIASLLLLFVLAAASCTLQTQEKSSIGDYLSALEIPASYTVYQSFNDSGFSGIDAAFEEITFEVNDGSYQPEGKLVEQMDMEELSTIDVAGFSDKILLEDGLSCFVGQQWGLSQQMMCFKDDMIVLYDKLTTKGNHQSIDEIWKLEGFSYPLESGKCSERDPIYCAVLAKALSEDTVNCDALSIVEYCKNLESRPGPDSN